jgi:hypothetical protein
MTNSKRRRSRALLALALCGLAMLGHSVDASANHAPADLVSRGQINGNGPFDAVLNFVSEDGSRLFFTSDEQLTSDDAHVGIDIFERSGGATTLITGGSIVGSGACGCDGVVGGSADGSRVFFATQDQLESGDTDDALDLYEHSGGTTTRISAGQINGNGPEGVFIEGHTADGTRVYFGTRESLVSTDTDSRRDVYERFAGTTTLISAGQVNGNGEQDASISGWSSDGTRVFFSTHESLVNTDTDSSRDVYQRFAGVTTLVSAGQINGNGAFDVFPAGGNDDGTRFFFTTSEPLVNTDIDTASDLYERSGGVTTLVSAGEINGNGAFDVEFGGSAADGSVFFRTSEPLTNADTDTALDIYRRSGTATTLVSDGENDADAAIDVSIFHTPHAGGARVLFSTREQLVSADTDTTRDVYARENGTTTLVSVGQTGGNGAFDVDAFFSAAEDGLRVYFRTQEKLVSADTDGAFDIYERCGGTTTLVSRGERAGNGAFDPSLTGLGSGGTIAFFETKEQLSYDDTDTATDIYAARLGSGPAPDGDCDGVPDSVDACPDTAASTSNGCVTPPVLAPACSDGVDNDGDGVVDAKDPGCLSGAGDVNEGDETLGDLVLCGRRVISLVRADPKGKKAVLSGLVAAKYANQEVSILANYKPAGKSAFGKIATVRANAAGEFKATVKGPSRKFFNKARFQAQVDKAKSVKLRLPQSLASTSVKLSGGQIVLKGKVKKALLGDRKPVIVKRVLCGRYLTVGKAKPKRSGSYTVRFDAPGQAVAALYRAETRVLRAPRSKKYRKQYARAIGITLTNQTG